MSATLEPGRLGNLTEEQDTKLRALWIEVNKVFEHGSKSSRDSIAETVQTKKSGWFGRSDSTAAPTDKHGEKQQYLEALKRFSPEVIRASFWSMLKADHPDAILLRFLRARKWDVQKALIMMIATMNWRAAEAHVDDDIMLNGEEGALRDLQSSDSAIRKRGEDTIAQLRMGKMYMHGIDLRGRPIFTIRVAKHKIGEYSTESLERGIVFLTETARLTLNPIIDSVCVVFDMTGFGLSNMDYRLLGFLFKLFEAYYPDCLDMVIVHNAPWIFQGCWKVLRGWVDPEYVDKIHFTNAATEIETWIARDNIPKELGGGDDWEYRYPELVPGENDRMADTETRDKIQGERDAITKELEGLTLDWLEDPNNLEVKEKRDRVVQEMGANYWTLDPYIRARSLFDRTGILKEGEKSDFRAWNV